MSVLEIVQAGHPVLRQVARPLERDEILVADIQQLIADMRDTMRAAPGVGLAAPQVGIGLAFAVIEDPATVSEEDLRTIALADAKVQSFIDGHKIVKVIVVPQRLVNVVVR